MKPTLFSIMVIMTSVFMTTNVKADIASASPHGFHWYSFEDTPKKKLTPKPTSSPQTPYQELMTIRAATQNKLAKAILHPSIESTVDYMRAQQFYAKKNQAFVRFWKQALLLHPELDYTLNFPTDNSAIAVRNDMTSSLTQEVIKKGALNYGLVLFYEGKSPVSRKFANHFMSFVDETHFQTISVATDDNLIQGLPNQRKIPLKIVQQRIDLVPHYMPALFLVNLKTQKMTPLSYGFVSIETLKERFLDLATDYKRYTYEGL